MKNLFGNIRHLLVAAAISLCFGSITLAQTVTGTLQGTVTDINGAVMPGAEVVLKNADTGQERTLKTNGDGFYVASFIPIGRYQVTVSQQGFTSMVKEDIEVGLNQTRVVDMTLNPVGVSAAVTVVSQEAPINTTNAEIKGSLNTQEI